MAAAAARVAIAATAIHAVRLATLAVRSAILAAPAESRARAIAANRLPPVTIATAEHKHLPDFKAGNAMNPVTTAKRESIRINRCVHLRIKRLGMTTVA